MPKPVISFDSYVNIAVSIDSHGYTRHHYQSDMTNCNEEENPDAVISEWRERIETWQKDQLGRGKSFDDFDDLEELEISAFFLQHPISAMSLWNAMQAFYEMDRLMCVTCQDSWTRVRDWQSMTIFKYLKAASVEKRWRKSLQNMRKYILANHVGIAPKFPSLGKSGHEDSVAGRMAMDSRISKIWCGTNELERACREVQRTFTAHLKEYQHAISMSEQIKQAAARRFSMIHKYLDLTDDEIRSAELTQDAKVGLNNAVLKGSNEYQEVVFKPLSRTNSRQVARRYAIIAFIATKRGEATFSAIGIVGAFLFFLYQMQWLLEVIR